MTATAASSSTSTTVREKLLKHGPSLVWAGVAAFGIVVGAYVALIVTGRPTDALAELLDWILRALTGLGVLGGAAAATSAARSARSTDQRMNGGLDARIEAGATRAIARALAGEDPPEATAAAVPPPRAGG